MMPTPKYPGRPAQSQTETAQRNLEQGTYGAQGEKLEFSLYDSEKLKSTILQHRFFAQGIGQPFTDQSAQKTLADTNIRQGSQIPFGQKFIAKSMKFFYKSLAAKTELTMQNMIDMFCESTITVKIDGKDRTLELNLLELMGNQVPAVITPSVAGDNINTGQTAVYAKTYPLNIPVVLASQTTWWVELEHAVAPDEAIDGDKIMLSFQGCFKRLS